MCQCYKWPKALDFEADPCHDDIMNKETKMTHDELIAMVMADYTAKVAADERRRQAIRDGLLPKPQPTTVWDISDRH